MPRQQSRAPCRFVLLCTLHFHPFSSCKPVLPVHLIPHTHTPTPPPPHQVPNTNPPKKNRAIIAIPLGIAMVVTQIIPGVANAKEWINLWPAAVLTAALMLVSGALSGDQARRSILWDVYLAIAGAFAVSAAMENTGVAKEFAQIFVSIGERSELEISNRRAEGCLQLPVCMCLLCSTCKPACP